MLDPLTQVIGLLRPSASYSKLVTASGQWAVRPPSTGPFYCVMLEGDCALRIHERAPVSLNPGDFVLIPSAEHFIVTSVAPPAKTIIDEPFESRPGVFHVGAPGGCDTRMLVGHCTFGSNDAALLVSLLPRQVVVRSERRLTMLVELLSEEARADRPGREIVLARLLEVLLIEAFRTTAQPSAAPGLLRGLADERISVALRHMHNEPSEAWTVHDLARKAGMSRSAFFDRFRREVGVPPMEYLLGWRMTIAKDWLRSARVRVADVAERVGYSAPSTFCVAFTRQVGTSPATYARLHSRPREGSASKP